MVVKIVTDSTSDISRELARYLGIDMVPGYVRFGQETYKDGVDLSKPRFYEKLTDSTFHPVTSEATPEDFAEVYSYYPGLVEGIVSIHISSKISRMYRSAQKAKKIVKAKDEIEIIDSRSASNGLALLVIAAARMANAGANMAYIVGEMKRMVNQISILGLFDTMKYVARGGRATKGVIELSSVFQVKPLLTVRDGEIVVDGIVHSYSSGMDKLCRFVESTPGVQDLSIAYSTNYGLAEELRQRLASVYPPDRVYMEQMGASLGAHSGPDALVVALSRA